MTDEEVAQLINNEFETKTLGVTEQYFEIHQPVYVNGRPKIDRLDREKQPDRIIAYLPVRDEYFSFAIYIDSIKKEIISIGTESRNTVCLRAVSEELNSNQLQSFTILNADKAWNKGDLKSNKKSIHNFSCIEITPNPEPDEFEDKLKKLLIFLQKDKAGVIALGFNANTYIQAVIDFHAGNQLLGGVTVDSECIKIMNDLNLEISFDFTAWGQSFK